MNRPLAQETKLLMRFALAFLAVSFQRQQDATRHSGLDGEALEAGLLEERE